MNSQFTINGLFSTPIIFSNINHSWTKKEIALFNMFAKGYIGMEEKLTTLHLRM